MLKVLRVFALLTFASSYSVNASAAVGRTPGQFSVSPAGSASYSIPLWTPPGIRGIQPSLALTYDSHLSYGFMGAGWTLSGLSVISRCNPTFAQDAAPAPITLTTADGLCLDGNRLRTTGTGVYQTEIANFSQITASGTAGNGPSYFTVQGKDGLTYEYGNTTDSRILPSGGSTPYIWALDKVTDRSGNQMTYTYYQAGGAYVPLTIKYTAPGGSTSFPYQVSFGYSTLSSTDPNTINRYIAGSQIQQTQQLSTITMSSSGTTVREYKLLYTTSTATLRATLTSIQECGGSAGTDCLSATAVGYQNGTAGVASPTTASGSGTTNGTVYSVDIDGDGRQDLVYAVTSGTNYQWWVQLATSAGYGSPINTGATSVGTTDFLLDDFDAKGGTEILTSNGGTWFAYKWNGSGFTATSTGISVVAGATYSSADVDGDGRPDIAYLTKSPTYVLTMSVQFNTSTGSTISFNATPVSTNVGAARACCVLVGNNQQPFSSVKHFDFDGDGRQDLMLGFVSGPQTFAVIPLLSRGASGFVSGTADYTTQDGSQFEAVNWNDDACTDIIVGAHLLLSQCNGSVATFINLPATPTLALDWDGDGRTDVLANVNGTWQVIRSEGNTYAAEVSTGIAVGTGTYIVTDQNADGLHDLAFADSTAGYAIKYGLHNGAFTPPDLAIAFSDGFGNSVSPTYLSIANGDFTESSNIPFPDVAYIGPYYVVSNVTFTDPSTNGGTYSEGYAYAYAVKNLQGRGFSGFGAIQQSDSRIGFFDTKNYNTEFPYTGTQWRDFYAQTYNNTVGVNTLTSTWTAATLDSTANNERYFPYVSSSIDLNYQVGGATNGAQISSTSTNYTYDLSGNVTAITKVVTDTDSASPYYNDTWTSSIANTISPNTSTWCLGLPTQVSVTNSNKVAGGGAITRTVNYTPDYTNCRETQRVIAPGSAYQVTEVYGFDSFGNISSDAVTGSGMAARTTLINWGSTGQFPTTVTNPLSQSVTYGYDPNSGMLTSQTDLNYTTGNPLQTKWVYDNFARKTQEVRPDSTYSVWTYYDCPNWGGCLFGSHALSIYQQDYYSDNSQGPGKTTYLDTVDRPLMTYTELLSGSYARNELRFDSLGRVAKRAMPCAGGSLTAVCPYWETYGYDMLNRITLSQRPISATNSTLQTTMYNYAGRTSTVMDALNNTTTKINLVTGSLAQSKDAKGYYQNFGYDSFGSLKSVTDSASNTLFTANYAYGIGTFQTSSNDMDLGARTYTIDALGEMTAYSDAKSQSFSITYDALSRPKVRTETDLTTTWTWGNTAASYNIGKLQSVTAVGSVGTYTEADTYDSKTRLSTRSLTLPGDATYVYTTTYNATTGFLDTLQYPLSTSSYQLKLQYAYANGLLQNIADYNNSATVFWTANTTNPRGQVTKETLGNGVVANRAYDAVTGWVGSIQSGVSSGAALQNSAFLYDDLGDVTQRQDNNQGLTENFYYDTDYRLDHSTLNGTVNLQMTYDTAGMGNIASRSDVAGGAAWTYDPSRKHAVTQAGSTSYTYTYDANGNAITRNGSAITWSSYNYPTAVSTASEEVQFWYGPNRERWKEYYTSSAGTEVTYRAGPLLEKVINGSTTDYRHYIYAGSEQVAVYSRMASGTNTLRYLLEDHQSSVANILTSTGTLDVSESFTAYGNRRSGETWSGAPTTADENAINGVSRRGYTGQTALGVSMGLNHLNGRIEDSVTGRFLSPDPYVPNPGGTQSFNRYSYVNNNPLSFVDPTGFDGTCDGCSFTVIGQVFGDIGSAFSDAGEAIASFFSSLFGGGGQKLDANQQAGQAHGVNISNAIQGAPAAAQASDGWKYSLDAGGATQGPQVAAASVAPVDESLTQTVTGVRPGPLTYESNGTNLAPLFGGIGRYNPLHAGIQTLQFGINGVLFGQAGIGIFSIARGTLAAEGLEGGLTLFRGVASDSPGFENALNGIANPIGGEASMLEHSLGNTASNFTSWTSDYDVAVGFATNRGATSGVILTTTFAPSAVFPAAPSIEAIMGESEFLVPGSVSGAIATGVR